MPQTQTLTINLGLANNPLSVPQNIATLAVYAQAQSIRPELKQSATEQTIVADIEIDPSTFNPVDFANKLCTFTNQDAVAFKLGGQGFLLGPKAEAWGPFNEEFFLTPSWHLEILNEGQVGRQPSDSELGYVL